tara:strand:- start:408 stop:677 length:270 start_codon:yes stop_codon:yes gene_type:complete
MKIELKSKETGKNISFNLKEVTMPLREQFVDAYMVAESNEPQKFSLWVNCVRIITDLTDDDLLKLTDLDIVQIAVECILIVNNKKKAKK